MDVISKSVDECMDACVYDEVAPLAELIDYKDDNSDSLSLHKPAAT